MNRHWGLRREWQAWQALAIHIVSFRSSSSYPHHIQTIPCKNLAERTQAAPYAAQSPMAAVSIHRCKGSLRDKLCPLPLSSGKQVFSPAPFFPLYLPLSPSISPFPFNKLCTQVLSAWSICLCPWPSPSKVPILAVIITVIVQPQWKSIWRSEN